MQLKILHKVDISEPIEWLNSFVCQKIKWRDKAVSGSNTFEQWIICTRHSAKLVGHILHRLNQARFFTLVDSTSSFLNHKLDEDSSKLTTFGTSYGRYIYLGIIMGASSSDIYQYKVDGHLEGIDHCVVITDYIIIYGFDNDGTYHEKTVKSVMKKAQQVGMHFISTKCQFRKTEVKFFGMMLNRHGVVPDPAKIEALRKLPELKTESLLKSFLSIVNYLSRFDPKITNLTHNLRGPLKKSN